MQNSHALEQVELNGVKPLLILLITPAVFPALTHQSVCSEKACSADFTSQYQVNLTVSDPSYTAGTMSLNEIKISLFCEVNMESEVDLGFASVMVEYNFLSDFSDKIKQARAFFLSSLCKRAQIEIHFTQQLPAW